jgi:hypothetical protein
LSLIPTTFKSFYEVIGMIDCDLLIWETFYINNVSKIKLFTFTNLDGESIFSIDICEIVISRPLNKNKISNKK